MSEDHGAAPVPQRRSVRPRDLELDGKQYVLVPKAEYERLQKRAEDAREDASAFAHESIGLDLRARRHEAGLTLSVLARRAGIAAETLSRIENGRTDPAVGTVRSILKALQQES